ncbi:hypothetical protein Glove_295g12 [Diversispora epigaea]|uniref:Uncharacterized protein n=1 Tax=Diversispora epigaea TaxID=1348612 RepID=A0A397I032_9GLOM|nr:hypothetical protein Glove_295g12 [Diversispora epigaea]
MRTEFMGSWVQVSRTFQNLLNSDLYLDDLIVEQIYYTTLPGNVQDMEFEKMG